MMRGICVELSSVYIMPGGEFTDGFIRSSSRRTIRVINSNEWYMTDKWQIFRHYKIK